MDGDEDVAKDTSDLISSPSYSISNDIYDGLKQLNKFFIGVPRGDKSSRGFTDASVPAHDISESAGIGAIGLNLVSLLVSIPT